MARKKALAPEQVDAYEEMSGFKTIGVVELYISDDVIWELAEDLFVGKTHAANDG